MNSVTTAPTKAMPLPTRTAPVAGPRRPATWRFPVEGRSNPMPTPTAASNSPSSGNPPTSIVSIIQLWGSAIPSLAISIRYRG